MLLETAAGENIEYGKQSLEVDQRLLQERWLC